MGKNTYYTSPLRVSKYVGSVGSVEAPDRAVTNLFLMAGAATLFRLNLNSFLKKQQFHFLKSSRVGNVHQGIFPIYLTPIAQPSTTTTTPTFFEYVPSFDCGLGRYHQQSGGDGFFKPRSDLRSLLRRTE